MRVLGILQAAGHCTTSLCAIPLAFQLQFHPFQIQFEAFELQSDIICAFQ